MFVPNIPEKSIIADGDAMAALASLKSSLYENHSYQYKHVPHLSTHTHPHTFTLIKSSHAPFLILFFKFTDNKCNHNYTHLFEITFVKYCWVLHFEIL